jgi:nucleotide-binding universal stress UspA family protein
LNFPELSLIFSTENGKPEFIMASPTHLEKLLVCTDGSSASQGALTASLELARTAGSAIYLLEVLSYIPAYEMQSPDLLPPPVVNLEWLAAQETGVRERLEIWKAEAAKQGINVEPRVRSSASSYDGILEEAGELQPDLIVMGRHGLTGLARLLMGSVTARVIGHSPYNVLVMPKDATLDFKRILVASDGSPHSEAAWKEALGLARWQGSSLIAVSAAPADKDIQTATQIVRKLQAAAESEGLMLDTLVPRGQPFEAIVKAAQFKGATLIVLGSHGRTGLKRLLMGSVAERVIGQAPCPVLVVKAGKGE